MIDDNTISAAILFAVAIAAIAVFASLTIIDSKRADAHSDEIERMKARHEKRHASRLRRLKYGPRRQPTIAMRKHLRDVSGKSFKTFIAKRRWVIR